MKSILALLLTTFSLFVHAQTPVLSPEQTIRQIYQGYAKGEDPIFYGDLGEKSIISERMKKVIRQDNLFTLPGEIGILDADPICACQDYEDLVLENIVITQPDETHADAVVRFRPFRDSDASVTLMLNLVAEKNRWLVDDVISEFGSTYQHIETSNQETAAKLQSLQREQPQEYIRELLSRVKEYSWPWTGVVSSQFMETMNKYWQASFRMQDASYLAEFHANPICDCEQSQFGQIDTISVVNRKADYARIRASFLLTNQQRKVQDFILRYANDRWIIDDFIPAESGSLLQRMQEVIRQNK
ncbi:MAG TPA: DUF3828 domain-containing protein [Klebsiella sp.]|jgi:hypothetical protein